MKELNLDFDTVVERKNTGSLKYDFALQRGMPENVIPLWVADMDFKTSSMVLDALKERVEHGIFGYTETDGAYFEAVRDWIKEKHDWETDEKWLVKTPGVVVALAMAVRAYTDIGDSVLIQQPVYYPFSEVIKDNGRLIVSSNLVLGSDGKYHIDFEDFECKIVSNKVKLFILCSPHNPVGRVWTREELERLGDICLRHGVIVVSDEIHSDFVYKPHKHSVFAGIKPEFAQNSVICTSPAKTFNLAGLQVSNIFIADSGLRKKFKKELAATGYSQLNAMAVLACETAYRYGDTWYQAMLEYVKGNIDYIKNFIDKRLPKLRVIEPEGTYLVWLDFRGLGLNREELEELVIKKAGLWLDAGTMFGESGLGFERLNAACPRSILQNALESLQRALN